MNKADRIIIALDTDNLKTAQLWVKQLKGSARHFKVGSELFTAAGHSAIDLVHDAGGNVFLDLKYHDIPNTVARSVEAAAKLQVWMLNVHASGGSKMLLAAVDALKKLNSKTPPILIAVTVLTSLSEDDLREVGIDRDAGSQVIELAKLVKSSGLSGVVASAREVREIKDVLGEKFLVITPGVRPLWTSKNDQARVATPRDTFEAGADFIVIGRPVTAAEDPKAAFERLLAEI